MVKIRQYSYFELASPVVSAADLTIRLGVEPDQIEVKGSVGVRGRARGLHSWRISDSVDGAVDEQIERLIARLAPGRAQLTSMASDPEIESRLQVVRYFHDPDGVHYAPAGTPIDGVREWPRPLGWHLPVSVIEFLSSTATSLDVDEYDFSPDEQDAR
ncbi:DUF4279 domain-containing protein [Nocardia yamanashiensis]|uniref:DUF4279 domain-containing protein n=1 Tax=Nocardia yamanashiensis TaxID=209247 RepID=UPI000B197B08|nr:DUF4279 domain-containing protein [Nocardia yamanashiensis]